LTTSGPCCSLNRMTDEAEYYGTLEETRHFAAVVDRLMQNPDLVQVMAVWCWASPNELMAPRAEVQAWGTSRTRSQQ
jgi:hypothetical protein